MHIFRLIFILLLILPSTLLADKLFSDVDIDINNLKTIIGTYDVDRAIIMQGKDLFVDNVNMDSFRGEVIISISDDDKIIRSTIKLQYEDDFFNSEKNAPYKYIFLDRNINLEKNIDNKDISNEMKLSAIGMHYYDEEKRLIWEVPLNKEMNIILVLRKSSDSIKRLTNRPYSLL